MSAKAGTDLGLKEMWVFDRKEREMKKKREKNRRLGRIGGMVLSVITLSAFVLETLPVTGNAASVGWTKIDGVFVNPAGEPIEGATLKGIDVSYHNGDIEWDEVKASDIDYAILRCGYGQDYESQDDEKWTEYAEECTRLGIPFGTYLYSYATTVAAAKSEAEHVLRLIKDYKLTYPVYYDMEDKKQAEVTAKRKAQIAEVFCAAIEAAGYQVGIYANTDWFTNKLTNSYFDTRDKWVAQYNNSCTYEGSYRMWQCTSSGKVSGISTKVDLNFWYDKEPEYQGNTPEKNSAVQEPEQLTGGAVSTDNPAAPGTDLPEENTGNPTPGALETDQNNQAQVPGTEENNQTQTPGTEENNQTQEPDKNSGEVPEELPKLELSAQELTLSYESNIVLTANQKVTWTSSDKTVVKIGSKGKLTPIGVGKAVITATTSAGETAECRVTVKKRIKDTEIAQIPDQPFTGKAVKPEVTVMDGETALVKGTDYKVVYSNNMGKGTASVKIKGKGYYKGTVEIPFQIIPKEKPASPIVSSISTKGTTVTLQWEKVSNASGYEIYRAAKKNGTYELKKEITKKSKVTYKDKKLVKGKKYYYKIRAYKDYGYGRKYSSYTKVNIKVK